MQLQLFVVVLFALTIPIRASIKETNLTVSLNNTYKLTCPVNSTWTKQGIFIKDSGVFKYDTTLVVAIRTPRDAVAYACENGSNVVYMTFNYCSTLKCSDGSKCINGPHKAHCIAGKKIPNNYNKQIIGVVLTVLFFYPLLLCIYKMHQKELDQDDPITTPITDTLKNTKEVIGKGINDISQRAFGENDHDSKGQANGATNPADLAQMQVLNNALSNMMVDPNTGQVVDMSNMDAVQQQLEMQKQMQIFNNNMNTINTIPMNIGPLPLLGQKSMPLLVQKSMPLSGLHSSFGPSLGSGVMFQSNNNLPDIVLNSDMPTKLTSGRLSPNSMAHLGSGLLPTCDLKTNKPVSLKPGDKNKNNQLDKK